MIDLLAVCAHPDDLEVCAAGIFIKAKEEGLTTGLIILTDGAASGKADAGERAQEAKEGARLMGLDYFRHLDFPDSALVFDQRAVSAVIPLLREASPRYLFTLHPDDYHPDHVAVGQVCQAAAFTAGLPRHGKDGNGWSYRNILYMTADRRTNARRPDLLVDVSDVMERKLAACRAHASQNVADFTAAYASALGALIGRPYAEGLYLRQALEVPSVSGLFGSAKQV